MALRAAGIAASALAVLASAAPAAAVGVPTVTVVAGGGTTAAHDVRTTAPYTIATDVNLLGPSDIAPGVSGNVLLTDDSGGRAYSFVPRAAILPVAGTGVPGGASYCPSALSPPGHLHAPIDTIVFNAFSLVSDGNYICTVNIATGASSLLTGGGRGWVDGDAQLNAQSRTIGDLEPFAATTSGVY